MEGPEVQVLAPQVGHVAGEALSPNGLWEIRLQGANEGITASGLYPPERVQVVHTESGAVCWEELGYYEQAALWSPEGGYLALSRTARTYVEVTIIHPDSGSAWEFTLPDGSPVPEYTFLPEDWGAWEDESTLRLTVGRGGEDGEQHTYRCFLRLEEEGLTGRTLEQTVEVLEDGYDLDHDGGDETVEVVTIWSPELQGQAAWYELRVRTADGTLLWQQDAAESHAGWISLFALDLEGKDYLLRYDPYMSQGAAAYTYEIFSLEQGREQVLRSNRVEFDVNFGSPVHQSYDPEAIAAFLREVHGYLDRSRLLLSTEGGSLHPRGSGADFREDSFCGEELFEGSIEENLRSYAASAQAARAGDAAAAPGADGEPTYDFDHDGTAETVRLTKQVQDAASGAVIWKLDVMEGGVSLWSDTAHTVHTGWNSVFACKVDGQDYLLCYYPTMYQGWCTYSYQVFSLDGTGGEAVLRETSVEFDLNWNRLDHSFDAEAVLAFVEGLNRTLDQGTLLMSSDDALAEADPRQPREALWWLREDSLCPDYTYDETASLGENLRSLEAAMEAAHAEVKPAEPG